MATATMKRYRVAVRIPILYEVEVDAMSAAEAESLARCEVDSGAMDSGEGTLDGVAVVVDSEGV